MTRIQDDVLVCRTKVVQHEAAERDLVKGYWAGVENKGGTTSASSLRSGERQTFGGRVKSGERMKFGGR